MPNTATTSKTATTLLARFGEGQRFGAEVEVIDAKLVKLRNDLGEWIADILAFSVWWWHSTEMMRSS